MIIIQKISLYLGYQQEGTINIYMLSVQVIQLVKQKSADSLRLHIWTWLFFMKPLWSKVCEFAVTLPRQVSSWQNQRDWQTRNSHCRVMGHQLIIVLNYNLPPIANLLSWNDTFIHTEQTSHQWWAGIMKFTSPNNEEWCHQYWCLSSSYGAVDKCTVYVDRWGFQFLGH